MRATLNLPDELVVEAQKITGEKSKTKAIATAVRGFVQQKRIEELLALRGKVRIDYDWKQEEDRELEAQREREKLLERGA